MNKITLSVIVIAIIAFAISLSADTIYVPDDYLTIQEAINHAQNYDYIIVRSGTYNENLVVDKNLSIIGEDMSNTRIIPANPDDVTVLVTNSSNLDFKEFTIENGSTAINGSEGGELSVLFCAIINNDTGIYSRLGSHFSLSRSIIAENNLGLELYADLATFNSYSIGLCEFGNNKTAAYIQRIGADNRSIISLKNNYFHDNIIKTLRLVEASFDYFEYNLFQNENVVFDGYNASVNLKQCTFVDCNTINASQSTDLNIKSSIIWGTQSLGDINSMTYSDSNIEFTGTGNISKYPQFCFLSDYKYHLLENSPCLDAGEPEQQGEDIIKHDMGYDDTALTSEDIKEIKGVPEEDSTHKTHYTWLSFPRAFNFYTYEFDDPVDVVPILNNFKPQMPVSIKLLNGDNRLMTTYTRNDEGGIWDPQSAFIQASNGYKIALFEEQVFDLPYSGVRLPEDFTKHLDAGSNYIGCWIAGSHDWATMLGTFLDCFTEIKAENWDLKKVGNSWIGPASATFDYGKAYYLVVDEEHCPQGIEFYWNSQAEKKSAFTKSDPEVFSYDEKPEYEVINIESIDGGDDIEEIGAFVDGVCVGASRVEDYPVQILAYTQDANKGDNTISFEVVTSNKSKTKMNDIYQYDIKKKQYVKSQIKFTGNGFHLIKLGNGDYQEHVIDAKITLNNYPNPFNPTTTISYGIPQDGKAKLQIFNLKGQLVKTLVEGIVKKGKYNAVWNGVDNTGKKVASGIYMYKLSTKDKTVTKKMLMLK